MITKLKIKNMHCPHCVARAQQALAPFGDVTVDLATKTATIHSAQALNITAIANALAAINQSLEEEIKH